MFTLEELRKIVASRKFQWSTKARLINNYYINTKANNYHESESTVAYQLNLTTAYLRESLMLARCIHHHPTLSLLPSRKEALNLINSTKDNPKEFRRQLTELSTRYKSIEQLAKIKREIPFAALKEVEEKKNEQSDNSPRD